MTDRQTKRPSNQPTDRQTNMRFHFQSCMQESLNSRDCSISLNQMLCVGALCLSLQLAGYLSGGYGYSQPGYSGTKMYRGGYGYSQRGKSGTRMHK